MTTVHRSGPFKQSNKKHKSGQHRSKGALKREAKGRQTSLRSICKTKHKLSREEKRHRLQQIRKHKQTIADEQKQRFFGANAPPLLTTVLSLDENYSADALRQILATADFEANTTTVDKNIVYLSIPRFKRRHALIVPDHTSLYDVLDALKVSDSVLILWPHAVELSDEAQLLLNAAMAHGLPGVTSCVHGLSVLTSGKAKEVARKNVTKLLEHHSFDKKFYETDTQAQALNLLRALGDSKKKCTTLQARRAHLIADCVERTTVENGQCDLLVRGYVRGGRCLNVNHAVHIPGYGDYLISAIDVAAKDPHPLVSAQQMQNTTGAYWTKTLKPDNHQWTLQSEVTPNPMEGEQTWPTKEEIADAERAALLEKEERKRTKLVPKGTSEYQAAWIIDSDDDNEDESDEGSDEEAMSTDEEDEMEDDVEEMQAMEVAESVASRSVRFDDNATVVSEIPASNYDQQNDDDDVEAYRKQRENELWPDEIDTPLEQPARVRFQKYRGLKSFRTSEWDKNENLPYDYARIFKFDNFQRTKKRVLRTDDKDETYCVMPGAYVRIHIAGVPTAVAEELCSENLTLAPLVIYGLLEHEQKMSVLNVCVRRHHSAEKRVIKNKSRLIFHVGYRRFAAAPVFSEHTNGDKHKIERFLPPVDTACVMSMFAPIMYPPASVLVFYEDARGRHRLLATGSVLSVSPDRMNIKRIVLSGHPYKIHTHSVVVRYMFFNPDDVRYFKPVELKTKYGWRGHIKEPLGTHGHMKCVFNGPINSNDTVLMQLYKRVFPKWTYEPSVPRPTLSSFAPLSAATTLSKLPQQEDMDV